MKDKVVLLTLAELLVNLAAGWLAAGLGAPFLPELTFWAKVGLLLINLGFSIMCLIAAIWLRKRRK